MVMKNNGKNKQKKVLTFPEGSVEKLKDTLPRRYKPFSQCGGWGWGGWSMPLMAVNKSQ